MLPKATGLMGETMSTWEAGRRLPPHHIITSVELHIWSLMEMYVAPTIAM